MTDIPLVNVLTDGVWLLLSELLKTKARQKPDTFFVSETPPGRDADEIYIGNSFGTIAIFTLHHQGVKYHNQVTGGDGIFVGFEELSKLLPVIQKVFE